ncbi:MAG: WD40/YVTN/BNR-like repeat-containing protein, partial [Gemmatimonadales bacterium]
MLFVSDSTGAVDLDFAPDNPNELYAAMWRGERKPWTIISGAREGGIYKSADGGSTWTKLGGGLPTDLVGKSDLAVSPADPNRLYVLMEAAPGGGLYRSDDRGATFQLVSTENGLIRRPFYYTNVDADPTNADIVYVNNEGFFRSSNGGKTWQRRPTPHGDNHDLWIDPADPRLMIQSNDGGANVTRDGGETWSTQENQPTAELYQVAVDDRFPYWLYAGQQDNTTIAVPSLPPFDAPAGPAALWRDVGGCETGPAIPKPGDPDIVYSNCKGQFGRFNQRTGQEKRYWVGAQSLYSHNPKDLKYRFQRVVPIHVSPHDPSTVYHASQFLHRSRDEGVTWETISPDLTANEPDKQVISGTPITRDITGEEYYSVIYAVRESSRERGVIWVGANDGPVHLTRDAGKTWQKVTPPDLPPGGRVQ